MEFIFPIQDNFSSLFRKSTHDDNLKFSTSTGILFGNSGSCKTNLLMQAAITLAAEDNKVLFVSPQKLSKLPSSVHGMKQPSSLTMKHIQFLYAKEGPELQGYLASIHLRPQEEWPTVIIVDDLNYYCCREENNESLSQLVLFAKLSSLIQEAAFFSTSKITGDESLMPNSKKPIWLAMMSWTLDAKESSLTLSDLEDITARIQNCECWHIKRRCTEKESSKHLFEMIRKTTSNDDLLINFCLRRVNPKLEVIYLEDIFLEKDEAASSSQQ